MAIANPWDATFSADPLATDLVSAGDDEIRDTRQTVRDELRIEHDIGDNTVGGTDDFTDTGRHNPGSARAYFLDSATWAAGPVALLQPSNAGAWPPTAAEVQVDRLASGILDNGRLWVNIADCQPYVREQEQTAAAWSPCNVDAGTSATAWVSLYPRSFSTQITANTNEQQAAIVNTREPINGAYNAGAGPLAATMGIGVDVPDDGKDYEIVVKAHVCYGSTANNADFGFWLVEDPAGVATDRDECLGRIRTADDVGHATLYRVEDNPTNGNTYVYIVDYAINIAAGTTVINPSTATTGHAVGDFAGTTSRSRLVVTVRPRYLSASYTF